MKRLTLLFTALGAITAISAFACPPQNEILFIAEFHGQEDMSPAYIDDARSEVVRSNSNAYIKAVSLNGQVLCSEDSRSYCGNRVALRNGPLTERDEVRIVIRDLFPDNPQSKADFVFVRSAPARDEGSKCRPIYPN